MPLVLFSGLAADGNVFAPQKLAFPQLFVPAWQKPEPNDTLNSYCERLAGIIPSEVDTIIGGASFGGIIALHVAQYCKPAAVILIGSVRSPSELPYWIRFCRPLRRLIPLLPVRLLQFCCAPIATQFARRLCPHYCGLARQFRDADPFVFKWSLARILDWNVAPVLNCPVFHIHGGRDFVLPVRYACPDTIVRGGGHVISLTHPREVNDFIRAAIAKITGETTDAPKAANGGL